jgi:SNF2 family DNA or RNA helicase
MLKSEIEEQLAVKEEQVIWVEMPESQRALYESWMAKHRSGLLKKVQQDGVSAHRMEILEAILRLRQICCHPWLVDPSLEGEALELSGKMDLVIQDLEAIVKEGRKALIYSQFTTMLKILEKTIKSQGWTYVYLDGSSKDRESLVDTFQKDAQTSLFLISLKAGGVGLNLSAADYVLIFDPWWNEAVEQQAIDRAHRIDRKGTVIARRYVTALSIEEKMMRLKAHKTSLARGLLEFETHISQLTVEDLYELLT